MKGQLSLFEPDFIKDSDCTKDTPVAYGEVDKPIYGTGKKLKLRISGRTDSEHMKKIYLSELLPLEEYDLIAILLSGGKDSIACYYKLLELGVPKEKMEFWHHDIDGGHPTRRMDWRCTQNYVRSFAEAEGVQLRLSWRVNGFFGELYRIGASEPVEWMEPDSGEIRQCRLSSNYLKCQEIKQKATNVWGSCRMRLSWSFSRDMYMADATDQRHGKNIAKGRNYDRYKKKYFNLYQNLHLGTWISAIHPWDCSRSRS